MSNETFVCRYCLDDIDMLKMKDILAPCNCRGSMNYVHKKCFQKITNETCNICKIDFPKLIVSNTQRNTISEIRYRFDDVFHEQTPEIQVNIINNQISLVLFSLYDIVYTTNIIIKSLFVITTIWIFYILSKVTIFVMIVLQCYIVLENAICYICGERYSELFKNRTTRLYKYIQYHIVRCLYMYRNTINKIIVPAIIVTVGYLYLSLYSKYVIGVLLISYYYLQ